MNVLLDGSGIRQNSGQLNVAEVVRLLSCNKLNSHESSYIDAEPQKSLYRFYPTKI